MRTVRFPLFLFAVFFAASSNAQVFADFTMDKTGGCSPIAINFTNLSTASVNAKYSWDFGNGNTSSLKNPSAIYLEEKTYTITLTITDGTQTATKTKTVTVYKRPVVDFAVAAAKVCLPQSVQFNSTSGPGDGYVTNYQWDFGDGSTQQGYSAQMSHYYSNEQTPAVSLTITNSYGCQASVTKSNIVEILPKIDPAFSIDKTLLCSTDESVQLTNNSTGPGTLLYNWNFGDGTSSAQKNPVHQFTKKNVYAVTLTVSNTVGCSVTSFPVSVNAGYFATDFTNRPLCREISFSSSSYLYPSSSFWQFGDGNSTYSYYSSLHTYASAGTYNVMLINTYNACKDTVTKTITVQDQVNFNSDIVMPSSICLGTYTNFSTKSSVAPGLMTWDFGDGSSYSTSFNSTSHLYNQPGTYTVKLVNTFGTCSETVTKNIVVNPLPDPKGFVIDYGGICGSPVTVKFKDTTAGATSWEWKLDNFYTNIFSTQQNASYAFTNDGYYTVWSKVSNVYGCSATTSKAVSVFRPSASIYYTYSSSPRGHYDCDSVAIKFAVNANQPIHSYQWNLGNGQTSTEASPQLTYNQQGIYNIALSYVTESGCAGTASYQVRVYGKAKADFDYTLACRDALNLQFFDKSYFPDGWEWKFGDGGSDYFRSSTNHLYADTGKYKVQLVSHVGHCTDTITKEVYANVLPSSVNIIKAVTTCEGNRGTVTFDQRSVRASGGTWDFGDGTVIPYDSSVHSVKHTYAASGGYTVGLTGFYNGCTLTSVRNVVVMLKQSPVLTANVNQICANGSINVQINNMQTNIYTGNVEWGQYYIDKFEFNNGTSFNGSMFSYFSWRYNTFNSTVSNLSAGATQLRFIVRTEYSGCFDTTNFINLQVNGPRSGFAIQNNDVCYKSQFVFTDTSKSTTSTPLSSWYWDFGDGTTQTGTASSQVSHVYNNPGSYAVRLTVSDASNCSSSFTKTITARGVKAGFTASGLYVPNVPLNTTISFYNNSYVWSTGAIEYKWIYGDGATSVNYTGSHTYAEAGTYTVLLVATDPVTSCSDTAKQVITVKDFQTAFAFTRSFIGSNSCPPVVLNINNLSIGYTRLVWDFGDGSTSTQSYPSHIYYSPGMYKITLYTYGYNGLTGTYIDSVEVKQPSAQLNADILQGCTSQSVKLQANGENVNQYVWDFGDGAVVTGATAFSHAYTSAGIYTPKLIVKDNKGCAASTELADKIIIDSLSVAIKGIPLLVCDSALINFTPDVFSFAERKIGTPLTYQWDFGTGNAADIANTKNPSFRYNLPGTYTVRFTVSSQYGCSKQVVATVVVNQKAHGMITAASEICQNDIVRFSGSANPNDNLQWKWDFANGTTSTQQNPSSTYTKEGVYPVTMIVTKNGCTDTSTHILIVHPKPVVNVSPRQSVLCFGDSVQLSATGGSGYLWLPATGLSNNALPNPKASPQASTRYVAQVTSDKGCKASDSIFITVATPVKLQLAAEADLCKGSGLQLKASGAAAYQWINNLTGLTNASIPDPVVHPLTTTLYTVVGSDTYHCFRDTANIQIVVHDLPAVNAGPDLTIVGGIPYQLNASASSDVVAWSWTPANYLSCINCPSPMATPKMQTSYTVKVSNAWGCTALDTVVLKLQCAISNVHIPTAFTPGNDGKNDIFYIKGSGVNSVRHFRIFNRWGQMVFERNNIGIDDRSAGWDGKYKGQWVETGTYVYMAEMECISGEVFSFKGTVTVIR
jgi:gliding motility-associated-like protein